MRLAIDHRRVYRLPRPQARLTQLLRLTPDDTDDQSVTDWQIHVDCDARMRAARDGFGNRVTMLYVEGPIAQIEIVVTGQLLTARSGGAVRGTSEPLPPALFLRATGLTTADAPLVAFARTHGANGDPHARVDSLNAAFHRRFARDDAAHVAGRTAAQAFARAVATPCDMAQMLIAAARSLGVPARYASGYSTGDGGRIVPHGWVEAHIGAHGWRAFDPCIGGMAGEGHARLAVGLDRTGAAPVAGSWPGEGDAAAEAGHAGHAAAQ